MRPRQNLKERETRAPIQYTQSLSSEIRRIKVTSSGMGRHYQHSLSLAERKVPILFCFPSFSWKVRDGKAKGLPESGDAINLGLGWLILLQ